MAPPSSTRRLWLALSRTPRLPAVSLLLALVLAACGRAVEGTLPPITAAVTPPAATPAPTTSLAAATASPAPSVTPSLTVPPSATPSPSPTSIPPRVVIISFDGLRPDAAQQAPMPNLLALAERGAYTWSAQTVRPPVTLSAHASMLTGLAPDAHGVLWNDYIPERGPITATTVFSLAHAAGYETVMVVGKEKFAHFDVPGTVDRYTFVTNGDQGVADQAIAEAALGFDLMLVHFPNPDFFGHSEGWMSATYLAQLPRSDEALGRLLAALPPDATVIVTADHGGHGFEHGANIPEDMTIPWIIAGPGVRAGHALAGPVSVADTAASAAQVLGLSLPAGALGRPVAEAFESALGAAPPDLLGGAWILGAPQSPARSEMPAAVLDGRIYVPGGFGGETVFQMYDPALDAWRELPPLPEGRHHLQAAALNGRVYVFGGAEAGGWSGTATAWAFDPETYAWTRLADMPEPRLGGGAVALGERLYVVGGVGGGSAALLEYDPATDAWQVLAPLTQPRDHVAAAVLAGEIWALGGRWQGIGELASVEIYNPASGQWREGPPMPRPHAGFGAATLAGHIVVAGGEIFMTGSETQAAFEVFDPATQAWAAGPDLPHPVHGVPVAVVGDRVYLLGGSDVAADIVNTGRVQIYTP
jgi:N-acetylneuraminic acid mutarotase